MPFNCQQFEVYEANIPEFVHELMPCALETISIGLSETEAIQRQSVTIYKCIENVHIRSA